jgi:2-(1,2-epoxy-1,2-dihydrophenyl)acetyl-CoA isomerase
MIQLTIENNIATITLNRPETYNSFNREMAFMMQDALEQCQEQSNIRVVVITGIGKAFCAGQDLVEVTAKDCLELDKIVTEHYNPIIEKIRKISKPVVAAVNGVAAGAGANLALACDIVIAKESASFVQAFSKIGLIPDSGGTYFLPRIIGLQKATALLFLGDKVTAAEAENLGMIYRCISNVDFENEVALLSQKLAQMPTTALGYTKKLLQSSYDNTLEVQLNQEAMYQTQASNTLDYQEGIQAFIEKRTPLFVGK